MEVILVCVDLVEAGFEVFADATEDRFEACEELISDHAVTIFWCEDQMRVEFVNDVSAGAKVVMCVHGPTILSV